MGIKLQKIVSGGQTGVDRAALDVAMALEIPHGGWCPKGRKAADGILDARYQLIETESEGYRQRTKFNVRDSDGTLILFIGQIEGGSQLTLQFTEKMRRPVMPLDIEKFENAHIQQFYDWIAGNKIQVLNVAGPSEKLASNYYSKSRLVLSELLSVFQ